MRSFPHLSPPVSVSHGGKPGSSRLWVPTVRELRRALESGEFLLHFQPQINLVTYRVAGAEALVRWRHPEHGLLPPAAFLHVAERSGLIGEMDDWVLGAAITEAATWKHRGYGDVRVCVNTSLKQLENRRFPELVEDALRRTGLPRENLELEITETHAMQCSSHALDTIRALHGSGIKLSIDDFGTGYANFVRLCQMPASRLKLDRSLVMEACTTPNAALITAAVVQLAHSLHLEVTAEGVEWDYQHDIMKAQGCDEIQGYYFGKPMPAQDFANYCAIKSPCVPIAAHASVASARLDTALPFLPQ